MKTLSHALSILCAAAILSGCASRSETAVYQEAGTTADIASGRDASLPTADAIADVDPAASSNQFHFSDIFSVRAEDNELVSQMRSAISQQPTFSEVAPAISIGASDGTLTLFGTVRSDSAKERLEQLARSLTGVRAVNNRLQVANIASATPMDTLAATSRGDEGTLSDVKTRDGVSGSAMQSGAETATIGMDSTAEQIAATSRPAGAARVYPPQSGSKTGTVNVEVLGSSDIDRLLADQIRHQLRTDISLTAALSRVKVVVAESRITLSGSVRNDVQKREIEAAIQRATGVSTIDNQLRVDASGTDPLPHNP